MAFLWSILKLIQVNAECFIATVYIVYFCFSLILSPLLFIEPLMNSVPVFSFDLPFSYGTDPNEVIF